MQWLNEKGQKDKQRSNTKKLKIEQDEQSYHEPILKMICIQENKIK